MDLGDDSSSSSAGAGAGAGKDSKDGKDAKAETKGAGYLATCLRCVHSSPRYRLRPSLTRLRLLDGRRGAPAAAADQHVWKLRIDGHRNAPGQSVLCIFFVYVLCCARLLACFVPPAPISVADSSACLCVRPTGPHG